MGQALTGAAAPYLAEQIHKLTERDPAAKAVAHAVLGAVTSYAAGNSALAGAAGAVTGELMAQLVMDELYPGKKVSELSETEKQTVSILGTLAAGLAGGVAGNSTTDAVAGGQAGKNAVENNSLNLAVQVGKMTAQGCMKISACRDRLIISGLGALLGIEASTSAMDALSDAERMNLIYLASLDDPAQLSNLNDAQKAAYESLTGKPLPNTGGDQHWEPGPSDTGGDQTATGNTPIHTGNDQSSGQGATNTGNTDGVPDTGGNTTVTPAPDGPSQDDLAYLAEGTKVSKPGISGKEGAKDVPSWAKGEKPFIGENGSKFAERLLDEKYGKGNYLKGPKTEYNQIKKWGDRAFTDPN